MATIKNFLLNLLFISLSFTPTLILNGLFKPYKRGFFCNDESIRKPKLDHEQINLLMLIVLAIIPAILLISVANWLSHNKYQCKQQEHSALRLTLNDLFLLCFGLGLTMIVVDTTKYAIGRHRPNFYRSCEPRIPKYDANNVKTLYRCQTLGAETVYNFITDYECTIKDIKYPKDLHLSFMSGHAAIMMFSAVFVSIILSQRLKTHFESTMDRLIVGSIIILYINLALFVGYTRVSDYRHHPTDVLAGLVTGALMASFVKYFIDKNHLSKCLSEDEYDVRFNRVEMKPIETQPFNLPEMV